MAPPRVPPVPNLAHRCTRLAKANFDISAKPRASLAFRAHIVLLGTRGALGVLGYLSYWGTLGTNLCAQWGTLLMWVYGVGKGVGCNVVATVEVR
jgi:hypothetical protein